MQLFITLITVLKTYFSIHMLLPMYFPEGSKIEQARKITFEVMCGQETEPGSVLYICSSHPTYLCSLPLFWAIYDNPDRM